MGEIVNLHARRKCRRREDDARQADKNRVRHGLTKAQKNAVRAERRRAEAVLDGHRLGGAQAGEDPA